MTSKSMMRALLTTSATVGLVLGCGSDTTNPPGTITITIPSGATGTGAAAYGTNPLHVPLDSHVAWKNEDSMTHTATSDTAIWDTDGIGAGSTSAAVTFDSAGTFPYHCTIHGVGSMSGIIIVP